MADLSLASLHRERHSGVHRPVLLVGVVACLAGAVWGCGGGSVPARPHRGAPARRAPIEAGLGAQGRELARLRRLRLAVYCAGHHGRDVALAFDDGPGPYTHYALSELRRAGARATFFLVAKSIRAYPTWPRRERTIGAIGDHTATHPYLPGLAPAAAAAQIRIGRDAAARASGAPVALFRPPYGAHTPFIDRTVNQDGMVEILWNVDSGDSDTRAPQNYAAITRNVLGGIVPGSIILLHENRGQTIRALRSILPGLARRHLRAVTIPELLAADPPSLAQLRAGPRGCRLSGPPTSGG